MGTSRRRRFGAPFAVCAESESGLRYPRYKRQPLSVSRRMQRTSRIQSEGRRYRGRWRRFHRRPGARIPPESAARADQRNRKPRWRVGRQSVRRNAHTKARRSETKLGQNRLTPPHTTAAFSLFCQVWLLVSEGAQVTISQLVLRLLVCISVFLPIASSSAQQIPENTYQDLHWRMIGPFRGGRTRAATGIPSQPNVFYMGQVNGGVWKSDDYGRT